MPVASNFGKDLASGRKSGIYQDDKKLKLGKRPTILKLEPHIIKQEPSKDDLPTIRPRGLPEDLNYEYGIYAVERKQSLRCPKGAKDEEARLLPFLPVRTASDADNLHNLPDATKREAERHFIVLTDATEAQKEDNLLKTEEALKIAEKFKSIINPESKDITQTELPKELQKKVSITHLEQKQIKLEELKKKLEVLAKPEPPPLQPKPPPPKPPKPPTPPQKIEEKHDKIHPVKKSKEENKSATKKEIDKMPKTKERIKKLKSIQKIKLTKPKKSLKSKSKKSTRKIMKKSKIIKRKKKKRYASESSSSSSSSSESSESDDDNNFMKMMLMMGMMGGQNGQTPMAYPQFGGQASPFGGPIPPWANVGPAPPNAYPGFQAPFPGPFPGPYPPGPYFPPPANRDFQAPIPPPYAHPPYYPGFGPRYGDGFGDRNIPPRYYGPSPGPPEIGGRPWREPSGQNMQEIDKEIRGSEYPTDTKPKYFSDNNGGGEMPIRRMEKPKDEEECEKTKCPPCPACPQQTKSKSKSKSKNKTFKKIPKFIKKNQGLNFDFLPHANCCTEIELTIEPDEPDPLECALNNGIMPVVCCYMPPSLSVDAKWPNCPQMQTQQQSQLGSSHPQLPGYSLNSDSFPQIKSWMEGAQSMAQSQGSQMTEQVSVSADITKSRKSRKTRLTRASFLGAPSQMIPSLRNSESTAKLPKEKEKEAAKYALQIAQDARKRGTNSSDSLPQLNSSDSDDELKIADSKRRATMILARQASRKSIYGKEILASPFYKKLMQSTEQAKDEASKQHKAFPTEQGKDSKPRKSNKILSSKAIKSKKPPPKLHHDKSHHHNHKHEDNDLPMTRPSVDKLSSKSERSVFSF